MNRKSETDRTDKMNGDAKTGRGRMRWRWMAVAAVLVAVAGVAVWSWFARLTAGGGVVTLRQTDIAPGRFPLVVRIYELSNGCARPLAFYRPDAQFPLFEFQTFVTNALEPHGCWESPPAGAFAGRPPQPTWIPAGGTASFSLELPDDRRPRRLLVPLFENALFRKRCAAVAISGDTAIFQSTPDILLFPVPTSNTAPLPLLFAHDDGSVSLDGQSRTIADILELLRAHLRRTGWWGALLDADDHAKLGQLVDLRNLCAQEGFEPTIATDSGPVALPNTMGEEWRLGDFANPEIENAEDLAKNDPFAPVIVRLDGADIYVNDVLCPETNLVARLAEASDDGARSLGFLWKGDEPCRSFKLVLAAYHDIGGSWPFLFW